MATVFDMLLADPSTYVTLYDSNEANPIPTTMVKSNVAALKTVRSAYDFTSGFLSAFARNGSKKLPRPFSGWLVQTNTGWFIVAKVEDLSAVSMTVPPTRVLLLHLVFQLAGYRGSLQTLVRVQPRDLTETHPPSTDIPMEHVHLLTPTGSDVQINDQLIYDVWIYKVIEKVPATLDGSQYGYQLTLERFAALPLGPDNPGGNMDGYLITNAHVKIQRLDENGIPQKYLDDVQVRWQAAKTQTDTPQGDPLHPMMWLMPNLLPDDLLESDIVTLLELDGQTFVDRPNVYSAGEVNHLPSPLIQCTLIGVLQ